MITENILTIEPSTPADTTIIWLHGLGADGHDFASLARALNHPHLRNARFLFPHAPVRPVTLNGGMPMRAWFDITSLDRNAPLDQKGLAETHQFLEQLIDQQLQQGVSAERIVLGGFSQGCAQVLYSGTRTQHPIAGIIGLSGYLPDAANTPAASGDRPILLMHGDYDDIVMPEFGDISHEKLQELGYHVDYHRYPIGHGVCPEQIILINRWLGELYS